MENEPTYLSPKEKFTNQINDRFDLWTSIIDASVVDQETKDEVKKRLLDFKQGALTKWQNIDDAFYGTISVILTSTERDKDKVEARALFENIRDDMWALSNEIKS